MSIGLNDDDIGTFRIPSASLSSRRMLADLSWEASAFLALWDASTVFLGGYICSLLYQFFYLPHGTSGDNAEFMGISLRLSLLGGILAPITLGHRIKSRPGSDVAALIWSASMRVAILLAVILAIGFLTRTLIHVPRVWLLTWSASIFGCAIGGRIFRIVDYGTAQFMRRKRIAVVGDPLLAMQLVSHLGKTGTFVEIIGLFQDQDDVTDGAAAPSGNGISRLLEIGGRRGLDQVVVAMQNANPERMVRLVDRLKMISAEVVLCPSLIDFGGLRTPVAQLGDVPMMVLVERPIGRLGLALKLLEDKLLGFCLLLLLLPLIAIIGAAVAIDSPGPIIFRQRRHGLNNTEFDVFKFRTMILDESSAKDVWQTKRNDPRVTRVGNFLRQSSLDELPQLFNVLRGEMSLVGPRPHPVAMRTQNLLCEDLVHNYGHRHRVRPGMTGWAQINGSRGATTSANQLQNRVEFDLYYIENWSILFDLKILLLTPIRILLDRENAF